MPKNANSIMQTCLATTEVLGKVLDSFTATSAQKDAAEASLADITTSLAMYSIDKVEVRSALLTALIVELNGVIEKIRLNPIGDVLARLNTLFDKANRLLDEEQGIIREQIPMPTAWVGGASHDDVASPMIEVSGIPQLIFSTGTVLSERLETTSDPDEKIALRALIEKISGLRISVNHPDASERGLLVAQLSEILDDTVKNLRVRPFDHVLGSLQRLGDEIAVVQGEISRDLRGGKAEIHDVSRAGGPVTHSTHVAAVEEGVRIPVEVDQEMAFQKPAAVFQSTDFAAIEDDYVRFFNNCQIRPEREAVVRRFYVKPLVAGRRQYETVGNSLGIPWWFIGVIHGLECSYNFRTHLHNGDPLTNRTLHHPAGRPRGNNPPFTWHQSALDALKLKSFDQESDWTLPKVLFRWEKYNGMGYRMRGLVSPYLWSFSTHYEKGKFVRDGIFDDEAVSGQCGAATLLRYLVQEGMVHLKPTTHEIVDETLPTSGAPTFLEALAASPLKSIKTELKFPGIIMKGTKDKGANCSVQKVQEWCCFHRCNTDVDGDFGPGTEGSLRRFQARLGLPESGVVNERTWLELTAPMRRVLKPSDPGTNVLIYDMTVGVARQHLTEHPIEIGGDNRGPWVRLYMNGKDGPDQLWCAGFVSFIVSQAALALKQDLPFKRQVSVDLLVKDAMSSGRFIPEADITSGPQRLNKLRPGCLFAVRKSNTDWIHTGIVFEVGPEAFKTIEGNTNDEGISNGFEVCMRSRSYKKKDFILLV